MGVRGLWSQQDGGPRHVVRGDWKPPSAREGGAVNPHDPEAEIARLKERAHCAGLACKTEQAVDTQTGAIVAVTTNGGAAGDTESIAETLPQAGEAAAEQIAETTYAGKYPGNFAGVEEVAADKGYHSNEVIRDPVEQGVRTYIVDRNAGLASGTRGGRNKRRCMPIEGGFVERAGSDCRPGVGNGSSETSRISSMPGAWTGFTSEVSQNSWCAAGVVRKNSVSSPNQAPNVL